jgi:hypothetical protein
MTGDILGVDFSGASEAGRDLWVTEATQSANGLRIERCYRAADEWGRDREDAHGGVAEHIAAGAFRTAGLDFPFSLPQGLLDAECGGSWNGLLNWVADGGGPSDPTAFAEQCRNSATRLTDGAVSNLRRETDLQRAGLCPYAPQVMYQTFYGARNVLKQLAAHNDTAVVPMQEDSDSQTAVCEVYPAATFGWLGCYREGYKNTAGERNRRKANVAALEDCSVDPGRFRETYIENDDALDSLAAAVSAARVDGGARPTPAGTRAEGCIYV